MEGRGYVRGAIELVVGVNGEGGRVVSGGSGRWGQWAGVGDRDYAVRGSRRRHACGCWDETGLRSSLEVQTEVGLAEELPGRGLCNTSLPQFSDVSKSTPFFTSFSSNPRINRWEGGTRLSAKPNNTPDHVRFF